MANRLFPVKLVVTSGNGLCQNASNRRFSLGIRFMDFAEGIVMKKLIIAVLVGCSQEAHLSPRWVAEWAAVANKVAPVAGAQAGLRPVAVKAVT
jgi:hypothetical protein